MFVVKSSAFMRAIMHSKQDDTNIFFSSNNIHDASVVTSRELIKLSRWFAINKLSLNVSKTNYMVFTNKKDISECQIHNHILINSPLRECL